MKSYQRASLAVFNEEIPSLFRRLVHKIFAKEKHNAVSNSELRQEHYQLAKDFYEKALKMGYGDLKNYYWYHTIDLGNGLITPGCYDYRSSWPSFQFPSEMEGMNVLDVGSATGFFAFEFEKREAHVISVELPSIVDLDSFPGESIQQTLKKLANMIRAHSVYAAEQYDYLFRESTLEEFYHCLLDGPFKFCHGVLNSKVKRCYSTIYDLCVEKLGTDGFDLIFVGDILLHTINPLKALAAVAPLCRGTLVISQVLPDVLNSQPAMLYVGGDKPGEDDVSWWWPNRLCFEQMLKKLGFKKVAMVGHHTGIVRPAGAAYKRAVIHATK